MQAMLFEGWRHIGPPYMFIPNGFTGSILINCPFLLFLARRQAGREAWKWLPWVAMAILCAFIWTHGNPGGWQVSARYMATLLPWILLVLMQNAPSRIGRLEWLVYGISVVINAWCVYLFNLSDVMGRVIGEN